MSDNISARPTPARSAKIYTFPRRGRFAQASNGDGFAASADFQMPRGVKVASGSAWYHEEAIAAERASTK
jgi:hypothetical protein